MKYEWYYCDSVKGTCDTYDEAIEELNRHLDFDITDISDHKTESSWSSGEITYFYPMSMSDEEIQNDDGSYTPQIKEPDIEEG